jgi:hypothetical protein
VAEGGELTGRHLRETGGVTQGPSSTGLLPCGGSIDHLAINGGVAFSDNMDWGNHKIPVVGILVNGAPGYNNGWHRPGGSRPNRFVFRMDGMVDLKAGSAQVQRKSDDDIFVWVDVNGNGEKDAGESGEKGCCSGGWNNMWNLNIPADGSYRVVIAGKEGGGGDYFSVRRNNTTWKVTGALNVVPEGQWNTAKTPNNGN